MIAALLVTLGLGDLAAAAHLIAHHRTGMTAAVLGALGWATHRLPRPKRPYTPRHSSRKATA